MASSVITASNLTSGGSTSAGTSVVTASITPTPDNLILITIATATSITADPNIPTASGCGLTWETVNSIVIDSTSASRRRVSVLRSMGKNPSTGTITLDFAGQTNAQFSWSIDQFSGVNTSGANGSGAVVQQVTNKQDEVTPGTSLTITLAAFSNAQNATFGGFGNNNGVVPMTKGSGFTLLNGQNVSGRPGILTEFNVANDTTVDITYTSDNGEGGVAIELKAGNDSLPNNYQFVRVGDGMSVGERIR